jgi:hypothetical protein
VNDTVTATDVPWDDDLPTDSLPEKLQLNIAPPTLEQLLNQEALLEHEIRGTRDHIARLAETEMSPLDRFVRAKTAKTVLERDLRLVKLDIDPLETKLLELFAQEGVSGKRHAASGKLVSITRKIWARADDKETAATAMRRLPNLAAFVGLSFNVQSVSSYFRELARTYLDEHGEPAELEQLLPPELHGLIELTEDHTLSVRS